MKARGIALGALILALAGCGITAGTVTGKAYDSAYSYVSSIPVSCGNGCVTQVPMVNWVPECWRMSLRSGDDTGSVCVDQPTWERTRVGDYYGIRP